MVVSCEQVWQEISNYLDGEVNPQLRAAMEAHFRECKHCTAVLDGTKNIVHLYADDRLVELPAGFQRRLAKKAGRIHARSPRNRLRMADRGGRTGPGFGQLRAGPVRFIPLTAVRNYMSEPGVGVPPGMMVEIASDGKTFHVPGCKYLHKHEREDQEGQAEVRLVAAAEAIREGYVPCVRCLRQYLNR